MTRRHLLGQALGAPALIAALGPLASAAPGGGATQVGGRLRTQRAPDLRFRLEILPRRCARCTSARFSRFRLEDPRPAPRLEHRRTIRRERAHRRPRRLPAHRRRLVSEAIPPSGFLRRPKRVHRIRRRLRERRSLDQRHLPRQAALRIHRLRLRSHPASQLRRRQCHRGPGG